MNALSISILHRRRTFGFVAAVLAAALGAGGCSTPELTTSAAVGGATAFGAHAPNNEIEQIYYVGSFDPQEQLPPAVYRIRVHGQASAISQTRFASGWVKAAVIDSLGSSVSFDDSGNATAGASPDTSGAMTTGRRLMLFGPEGFREAPTDHRLVIVMGASPEDFFNAIDQSLGVIAEVQREQIDSEFAQTLFGELTRVQDEAIRLEELERAVSG